MNLTIKYLIPHEAKIDFEATRVLQSVIDSCEIIMMLMKNLKNYKTKNVTQKIFNILPLEHT